MRAHIQECSLNGMDTERRQKLRIYDRIPVKVRGVGPDGEHFEFDTVTKNISAGGLCAPAPRTVRVGDKLTFQIRFALAGSTPAQAPTVSARGMVLRSEELPDGTSQFAAAFTLRRIL
jgi:hypothetical protein